MSKKINMKYKKFKKLLAKVNIDTKYYLDFSIWAEKHQFEHIKDCVGVSSGMYRIVQSGFGLTGLSKKEINTIYRNMTKLIPIYIKQKGGE